MTFLSALPYLKLKRALFAVLLLFLPLDAALSLTPEEVKSGTLLLQEESGTYYSALQLSADANVTIAGMTATVELTQHFRNDSTEWREAIYVFPLPENAAVYAMEMRIGERTIIGAIREKKQAQAIYQAAKKAGKIAALTEQQRPNLFTQQVANIPPNANIEIKLCYQQTIHYDFGVFSWRLPLTITPRYIPGAAITQDELATRFSENTNRATLNSNPFGWAVATDQVPDAAAITPPMEENSGKIQHAFSLNVDINSGLPLASVRSPSHEIAVAFESNKHNIVLTQPAVNLDRDFVLEWMPSHGNSPTAAAYTEITNNEYFVSVMLVPPQTGNRQILARDVLFVIDTSGSMGGVSIRQAKASLRLALERLKPHDRFNIIEFNSTHSSLYSQLASADTRAIDHAKNWVTNLRADGGTEMQPALEAALSAFQSEGNLQQLIFITDGAIGNESALFELIHAQLGNTRLFTIGIGSAPNAYFMKKAAAFGRGTYTFVNDTNQIASDMNELFLKLESALATDIQIEWNSVADMYPSAISDLYAGEPLLVTARLDSPTDSIRLSGKTQDQSWSKTLSLDFARNTTGVARSWARRKIEALEDLSIKHGDSEKYRNEILSLALENNLVSRYTSFVAVEEKIRRPANKPIHSNAIPNIMPAGSQQAVPHANTATPAQLLFILGALTLCGFLMLKIKEPV